MENAKRRRKIVNHTYKGFELGNEEAYDTKLLDADIDAITSSLKEHSKVLAKRIDLHLPKDTQPDKCNEMFSDVMGEIVRNFNRPRKRGVPKQRPSLDARYVMTTEQNEAETPHAHLVLTLNGNRVQNGYYPMQEIKAIAERKLGSDTLVHECRNGEWMLHRGNEAELREVVKATSYIAKVRTKENNQGREMMRSQLNKRKKPNGR